MKGGSWVLKGGNWVLKGGNWVSEADIWLKEDQDRTLGREDGLTQRDTNPIQLAIDFEEF